MNSRTVQGCFTGVKRSTPPGPANPGRPGFGARAVQAKGGNLLRQLAQPRVFPGPEVEAQRQIVEELDEITARECDMLAVICIGGIVLPEVLPESKEEVIRACRLIEVRDSSVRNKFDLIADNAGIKRLIVRNTISTMDQAGQLGYLRASGLTGGGWKVLVEIHYYRDRFQGQVGFHKDTLGQTLFVNLNYVTSHTIAGPEYVVNPRPVEGHDRNIAESLPGTFLKHVGKARQKLGEPTEIGTAAIPAHGVVAFVDELIHHTTPLIGHRTITGQQLAAYLAEKFPVEYQNAVAAYDAYQKTTYAWGIAATAGSWVGSWFSTAVDQSRKWYHWIAMTRQKGAKYNRTQLAGARFSPRVIDELIARHDQGADPQGRFPFERVSIPKAGGNAPVLGEGRPPLKRRMSINAQTNNLPRTVTGKRRFFRTWVRAVPR